MSMYASNAGKSGGEFYTPQEVSELLTKLAIVGKTSVNKVYDPACGSGSLLLKSAKILGKENVRNGFYGRIFTSFSFLFPTVAPNLLLFTSISSNNPEKSSSLSAPFAEFSILLNIFSNFMI